MFVLTEITTFLLRLILNNWWTMDLKTIGCYHCSANGSVWFMLVILCVGKLRIAIINHSLKRFAVVNCGLVTGGDFPPIPGSKYQ